MKKALEFLGGFREKGIHLALDPSGNHLKVKGNIASLTVQDKEALVLHKADILALLKNSAAASFTTITPVAAQAHYALSSSQTRLWLLSQFEASSIAYNVPVAYQFEGELDVALFAATLDALIARHEILRTVFREDEQGDVRQYVLAPEATRFNLAYVDLQAQAEPAAVARALVKEAATTAFDLQNGPLLRASLLQLQPTHWVFTCTLHHIISDGWSMQVLVQELLLLYNAKVHKQASPLALLRIQYKDYAAWQAQQLSETSLQVHRAYWLEQLAGELPVLALPADKVRPTVKTYNGSVVRALLEAPLCEALRSLTQEQGSTLFMGLLAAVNALLFRYTQQQDLLVGSPIAGREHADLANQIGFYVNTLALRTRLESTDNFTQLLGKTKQTVLDAYQHQAYPFERLVQEVPFVRDSSRNALFDVMVVLQNADSTGAPQQLGGVVITPYEEDSQASSKLDLTFHFYEVAAALEVRLEYNSDIYSQATAEQLSRHLKQLLTAALASPTTPLAKLPYLTAAEQQVLAAFNATATPLPQNHTLVTLVEAQARAKPTALALYYQGTQITYAELQQQSNQFAAYLRRQYTIGPDDLVALQLERTEQAIIALLGILKAGGAYVPIDPAYPQDRIAFMLADSACKAVVDAAELARFKAEAHHYSPQHRAHTPQPTDLAYVIYTSGSTGQPKGVMLEHRTVVNTIQAQQLAFAVQEGERMLQFASLSFDASVSEIFVALASGSPLYLITEEEKKSPLLLQGYLTEHAIDLATIPPVYLKAIDIPAIKSLKKLVTAGEAAVVDKAAEYSTYGTYFNAYGPTESSICATVLRINQGEWVDKTSVPIGTPIANTQVYILDEAAGLQPVGVVGELCLAGAGLARGYLNAPELTAQKFVANPFNEGERLYRTGDLGRWLPDGNLEFIGRKDNQVKIRGYRIELGEIESMLQRHPAVEAATVVVQSSATGDKELVAYLTCSATLSMSDIRQFLKLELPAHMLPSHYVRLEAMPVTTNGKIDKRRLPALAGVALGAGRAYVAPRTPTEEKLAGIWQELLQQPAISVTDDFFELGGHSLLANRLASRLNKDFDVKVTLADLFSASVLEQQAQLLAQSQPAVFAGIPRVAPRPGYPLSSAQRRLWLMSQLEGGSTAYNIPGAYVFEGALNTQALAQALHHLLARHESLRTVFREDETGEVSQVVLPMGKTGFQLVKQDLRTVATATTQVQALVAEMGTTPFDLATGPLLRAGLYRTTDTCWVFACAMHHIISDGWSMLLLVRELLQSYECYYEGVAPALPALPIQYKDYAAWQQTQASAEAAQAHRTFWLQELAGELPILALPGDKARPALKTYHGDAVVLRLDASLTKGLKALVQAQEATLFMGLLATVNALLYRYSGQEDIVLGTIVAGREHSELEDQIGLYINTLALRTRFAGSDSFESLLRTIKARTLAAYEHQEYPFDELVGALRLQHDKSRNPLFDVSVVLQIEDMPQATGLAQGSVDVKAYQAETGYISKFDISFDFIEVGDELHTSLVFNTDIYHRDSIERLGQHLVQLLAAALASPAEALEKLDYLHPAEKKLLTQTFNDTAVAYPRDQSIVALFAEQVRRTPAKVAVAFEDTALTYQALHEQTDKLAAYLRNEAQVQPGDRVGILLDRSEKVLVAILGILKAGAAYVPLEVEHPRARQQFMLADTAARVLITQTDYLFDLDFYTGTMFAIDVQLDDLPAAAPAPSAGLATDLAYVMYTSGSTGQPKGVLVDHRSVVRLVKASNFVALTGNEVLLATGALSFDATTFEYWSMLLNGGQLVMTRRDVLLDTKALAAEISKRQVTIMWFTAGWLNHLVDLDSSLFTGLKTLVAGGDKLSPPHMRRLLQQHPGLAIVNGYGPTENTTFSLTYPVTEAKAAIPVGKPISNSQVYILDHRMGLLPIGAVGEICVGGDGLARGYLQQEALTAERFVPNPFQAGTRLYKTGDLGRWLPDGNVAFIGRTDNQVKIRGFRVELAEIESALQQLPGIEGAVVLARSTGPADKVLVAYLTGSGEPKPAEVKARLEAQLPAYMVPAHLVYLEAFPLTANGKIDRQALPDPTSTAEPTAHVAPRNEHETQLAAIWQQLLGRQSVGVTENFFELGGDSIKILRMVSEVRQKMSLEMAVADVYKHGTIEHILTHTLQKQGLANRRVVAEAAALATMEAQKARILAALPLAQRENVEDIFPMSDIERGMVYESLMHAGQGIYHDQMVHQRAYPGFDLGRFRHALALLVQKHAILRTSFQLGTFEADVQVVHRTVEVNLPFEDLAGLALAEQEATVQAYIAAEHQRPFDLAQAPLWRMKAFGLGADELVLVFQFHHAILDGWSHASLVTELNNLYLLLGTEPAYQPSPLKSSYKDFIIQHEADKQDEAVRAYWQQELSGYKRLDLFTEEQQPFTSYTHVAGQDYERQLEKLAGELHTSVKTISLAAYLYLLRLLTYEGDLVAGLVTNTRPDCEDGDKVLGCFLNTVPLRLAVGDELSAAQFIGQVQAKLVALKENERLSLLEIAGLHNVQLRTGNPFFDTFFNYIDFHTYGALQGEGEVAQEVAVEGNAHTNILLDVNVNRTGGMYAVSFKLSRKMRAGHTVEDLGQLYLRILDGFLHRTHQALRHGHYLGLAEEQQLLHAYNETTTPHAGTVLELFAAQVRQHPLRPALAFGSRKVSYQALHNRSNQLARFLKAHYALQPDDLVGLKLERSDNLLVALLGVLKAGAAYVPIDPGYPQERIDYILEDSQCKLLLDETLLHTFGQQSSQWSPDDLPLADTAQHLAYVIYTSGSTGKPKGCGITHHNLRNYIGWANQYYFPGSEPASFGLYTSLSFDLTVTSIFCPLTQGGELYIYPQHAEIHDILAHSFGGTSAINAIKLTPSHINVVAGLGLASPAVRCAIVGGEQLTPAQVQTLHHINPALRVYNEYGPTEATVGCVVALLHAGEAIHIGQPIANTQVYVLNSAGMLAPQGVVGELFVGGDGVAQGYLHKPALTQERFTPNPFQPGTRLYGTGDLVRWNQAGNLEYLGRKDSQLKIRGYRVEPGEAESVLNSHPDIFAAVVLATRHQGEAELVAYVVWKEGRHQAPLRKYLQQALPEYMLPTRYVALPEFPLTPNGKIDKEKLAALDLAAPARAYVAPSTATEARLAAIWQQVLGQEQVSATDNFLEIGGHSLKATRLANLIHKEFEVRVALKDLFACPQLAEQAQLIDNLGKTSFTQIAPLAPQPHYALSSSQRRLWVLSQLADGNVAYNMPGVLVFEGDLQVAGIDYAFQQLLARHEILRTVFREAETGEVRQFIRPAAELAFAVGHHDLRAATEPAAAARLVVEAAFAQAFDLAQGPLLRAELVQVEDHKWVFAYVLHHIISDGWSMEILVQELLQLYNAHCQHHAPALRPLPIQYKEFAAWQQQQLSGEALQAQQAYWLGQLAGELPVLELPADNVRPALKTYNGGIVHKVLAADLSQAIGALAQAQGATLFMGLLAAVNALLYRYTHQEDILVGSPVAGREHADLQDQIGFYVNTLVLRSRFSGADSYLALLEQAKQVTVGALEHQAYPFDELVSALRLQRDVSRNVLFDVMLVVQNGGPAPAHASHALQGITVLPFEQQAQAVQHKFDLTFNFSEAGGELRLGLEYNSDIFGRATAERLASHLVQLLAAIVQAPAMPVQDLQYLSAPEQAQLLLAFNDTAVPYPRAQSVVDLFEAHAAATPSHVALVCEGRHLTYGELNERTNQFAHYLRAHHALQADDLVGVLLERSEWMIVSILGILKAGAAYVPIDPDYPQERIDYILADSQCKLLVDAEALASFRAQASQYPGTNPEATSTQHNLAYVIYTSGTTGNPKGVLIERGNLTARIHYFRQMYGLTAADNLLFYRSYSFDGAIEEYLLPVLSGARCFIAPPHFKQDLLANLVHFIAEHQITKVNMPPVLLGELVQLADAEVLAKLASLKHVVSGGDKLTLQIITSYLAKFTATLYNSYGPTENTIDSTNWVVAGTPTLVPIGLPVPNSQAFVLDDRQHLLPIGVQGELYVSGDGLARGYLRQPLLTAEKFVPNPYRPGELMYKTGDLVRWLPDGNLEFIGRKDDQVKIRGFRIELGEIEAALHLHPAVAGATVVARASGAGDKNLVAYVVAPQPLSAVELRAFLAKTLPAYMLPHHYVQLEAMPVTAHGKTDRKALPDPATVGMGTGVAYEPARTEAERQLAQVFAEVLKQERVGIKDDFFALGGDSIKSIQVVARLKQRGFALSIQHLLLHPVVAELATYLQVVRRASEQAAIVGEVPLSPTQAAFLGRPLVARHHHNRSVLLQSAQPLVEAGVRAALASLVQHHDALRLSFRQAPTGWVQQNEAPGTAATLEVHTAADEAALRAHCDRLQASLFLEGGGLFRAALLRHPAGDRLLLVAHQLVADVASWPIIVEDFTAAYQQYLQDKPLHLPQKTDSFRYWQQLAQGASWQPEAPYWDALAALPVAALPLDKPQGRNTVQDAATVAFALPAAATHRLLTQCHAAYRTDLTDVVLTAVALALQETFGLAQVRLVLHTPGRVPLGADADVTRTVGCFTTAYPVVLDTQYYADPVRQLIAVKEHLHRVPSQGAGYGWLHPLAGEAAEDNTPEIVVSLGESEVTPSGSLFTVSQAYRGLELAAEQPRAAILHLAAQVAHGQLCLRIDYSAAQYEVATMQRLAQLCERQLLALEHLLAGTAQPQPTPVDFTWPHLAVEQLLGLENAADIEDIYPLSPLQEGFFYHWLSNPAAAVYFEQTSYRVKATLDVALLAESYRRLVARHAALRTTFTQDFADQPLQVVRRAAAPNFRFESLLNEPALEEAVAARKVQERAGGANLHAEVPIRLTVLGVGPGEYEFIWSHHHILMDGWCGSILIKEFFQFYRSLLAGQSLQLPPVQPYANYIAWLMQRDQAAATQYWAQYLAGYDTRCTLPRQPAEHQAGQPTQQLDYTLAAPVRQRLRACCAALGITENTFVQTAWGILLSRYNNTADVVFGAVVSGRPAELVGVEEMVGLFVNTIPVRVHAPGTATVAELLHEGQRAAIAGVEYHYTQLADIQTASELGQHLFDHLLVFENFPVQELVASSLGQGAADDLTLLSAEAFEQGSYPLSVLVIPGEALTFQFRYDPAQFAEADMSRLQYHLGRIMEAMAADPTVQVQAIDYLSAAEQQQQLAAFNDYHAAYPVDKTLAALFEAQAVATPATLALVYGETTFTYQALNAQANQLAHYLQQQYQVRATDLLGIRLERSEWLVISILAVLKTGAAYVPIDPDYPQERIDYILEDSQCKVVLDARLLQAFAEAAPPAAPENPTPASQATDLAYVIYTSGSTGQPKGVAIEHAAIINTIYAQQQAFDVVPGERHLQFASPAFDASVSEIFVALLSGSTLHVVSESLKRSPALFQAYLTAHAIDLATLPPAYLKLLEVAQLSGLRKLVTAGEAAVAETAQAFAGTGLYFNAYGPTEASICASVYRLSPSLPATARHIPIGRPLHNAQLYVTDDYRNLMPLGTVGEICIGGAGLARGYLHKPALTAEKFVANPFEPGKRLYRTGDLGRWLPDGNLEFVGRKDDQVKIRGHRVEPGEIEAALLRHPTVSAAVVLAPLAADGERFLVAYLTGSAELRVAEVRAHLAAMLPAFMLPAHYVPLATLPVTPHGKVDRRQLPDPLAHSDEARRPCTPPRTELEAELVRIWQEILGRTQVGIHDNFFELGGNSIKIIRLAKAVSRALNQEVSVTLLFQYASIQELVDFFTAEAAPLQEETFDKDELLADLDKFNFSTDDFN